MKLELRKATTKSWTLIWLFVFGFGCSTVSAAVEITDLGTLGGEYSFAYAINDLDQAVGRSWMVNGPSHAFLYSNGKMTDLYPLNSQEIGTLGPTGINNFGQVVSGVIGADSIYYPAMYDHRTGVVAILGSLGGATGDGFNGVATAINNLGQAVGYSYVDDRWMHAFVYDNGVMQDIGCFPDDARSCFTYALDINDRGQVVGGGSGGAFLYANGVMTDITPFGSSQSYAYAINNRGHVVGYYYKSGYVGAFLYSNGTFRDIGAAESPETVAYDINEHGQAVGYTLVLPESSCRDCNDYRVHAFIYEKGVMTDLNSLLPPGSEWELIEAFAINNKGRIAGYGLIHGQRRAFVLRLALPDPPVLRSCGICVSGATADDWLVRPHNFPSDRGRSIHPFMSPARRPCASRHFVDLR